MLIEIDNKIVGRIHYRNFTIKYDSEFDDCIKLINEEM